MEAVRRCFVACSIVLCAGALLSSCVQIETVVKLNQDGSAVITERLRFSKRLLDAGGKAGSELDVERFLTREAVLKRMASMGKGLSLDKHEVRRTPDGGRESVATFKTPDINNFKYVSPWLAYRDYAHNSWVQCKLQPAYKSSAYGRERAGEMYVNFVHMKKPAPGSKPQRGAPPPKGPSPRKLQAYRNLAPLLRDAFKDFHVKLTFESYAPIMRSNLGLRGRGGRTKKIDLINFSWQDRDKFGDAFLDNEEIMLDIARWDLGSADIVSHVKGFPNNKTVPVFVPFGSAGGHIPFKPSRFLFDKHFKGKKLDYSEWAPSPPEKHVPAVFEKIGWQDK